MRIRKDTNFSANHNTIFVMVMDCPDVCGYAKVLIFLQITTQNLMDVLLTMMYADTQRY